MKTEFQIGIGLLALCSLAPQASFAESPAVIQRAQAFYRMLSRGSLQPENPLYSQIVRAAGANDWSTAAHLITDNPGQDPTFYDVAIRQFCLAGFNPSQALDEGTAICIGSTRDSATSSTLTVKDMFTAGVTYNDPNISRNQALISSGTAPIPYDASNPSPHYLQIDSVESPAKALQRDTTSAPNGVGFITASSPYGINLWRNGTKRKVFRQIVADSWCLAQTEIENANIPSTYVRRDHLQADAPAGDIVGRCYNCHSRMDATYGAFTHHKWMGNSVQFLGNALFDDQVNNVKRPTYFWDNDQWHFFVTASEQTLFGIQGPFTGAFNGQQGLQEKVGNGLVAFMNMVTDSDLFAKCFATRVAYQVYTGQIWTLTGHDAAARTIEQQQASTIQQLATQFKSSRNLVDLFRRAAIAYINTNP